MEVLTFQWPQGLCLTLHVMIVSVSKHFLSSAGALLSVHTVKLVPQCVSCQARGSSAPDLSSHLIWFNKADSCHFESDSVLTRQSVDTSRSWGLPSFSCKFESKLCSPHQGFVFFLNFHTLVFITFHSFTQNMKPVSFILNGRSHFTQCNKTIAVHFMYSHYIFVVCSFCSTVENVTFYRSKQKAKTRLFCNQTTLLEGWSAITWFNWHAGPSSVTGDPCWGCTSRHSRLRSDASQPSCRQSRRRWIWWSRTSWKCGSVGDKHSQLTHAGKQKINQYSYEFSKVNSSSCESISVHQHILSQWSLKALGTSQPRTYTTKESLSAALAHLNRTTAELVGLISCRAFPSSTVLMLDTFLMGTDVTFWRPGNLNLALRRASMMCSLFWALVRTDMITWPMWTRATVPCGLPKAPRIPVWSLRSRANKRPKRLIKKMPQVGFHQ